jgi:hypothetical protein
MIRDLHLFITSLDGETSAFSRPRRRMGLWKHSSFSRESQETFAHNDEDDGDDDDYNDDNVNSNVTKEENSYDNNKNSLGRSGWKAKLAVK